MPSNPNVRHLGTVTDLLGVPVHVGVDYAAVTIGPYTLDPADETFAQLFAAACHAAKAHAEAARAEAREEALEAALEAKAAS